MAKGYKGIGGGLYRNIKAGSPRQGKTFRKVDGAHVYKIGGKKVSIKGAPKAKAPAKPKQAPFDLAAPLTRKTYNAELRAATGLKFGPAESQIGAERRISDQQTTNTGSWYDDYLRDAAAATQRGQQGFQQAASNIRTATDTAHQQSLTQNAQLSQQAQEAAAKLGATANPELDALAARAAQSRQQTGLNQAGLVDSLGASNNAYMADRGRIGAGAKLSALQQEQGNRRKVEQAAHDLSTQKGQFRAEFRTQTREKERQYGLERAAFGLDTMKAKLDAQDAAAKRKAAARKLRVDQRNKNRDFAAGRDDEAFDRGAKLTDQEIARQGAAAKGKSKYRVAPRYGKTAVSLAKGTTNRAKFHDLLARYKGGEDAPKGANRAMLKAVAEYGKGGAVSPATARQVYKLFGFKLKIKSKSKSKNIKTVAGIPVIGGKPTP